MILATVIHVLEHKMGYEHLPELLCSLSYKKHLVDVRLQDRRALQTLSVQSGRRGKERALNSGCGLGRHEYDGNGRCSWYSYKKKLTLTLSKKKSPTHLNLFRRSTPLPAPQGVHVGICLRLKMY